MYCVKCGKELPYCANFCNYCAADMRVYKEAIKKEISKNEITSDTSYTAVPDLYTNIPKSAPAKRNPFAVLGIIFSIVTIVLGFLTFYVSFSATVSYAHTIPTFILGLTFSILGFISTVRKKNRLPGRGMAIASLILSVLCLCAMLMPLFIIFLRVILYVIFV